MLTSFFLDLAAQCEDRLERREGVAFLKALQSLYGVADLSYFCLNLPRNPGPPSFLNCHYSSTATLQKTGPQTLQADKLADLGLLQMAVVDWREHERLTIELELRSASVKASSTPAQGFSFQLNPSYGEVVLFGVILGCGASHWPARKAALAEELRIRGPQRRKGLAGG